MSYEKKTVHIQGKDALIEQAVDVTLLECLENHHIELHSHCREGFCGTCRTKILSGEVEYIIDPLAYIDDDEILPCCCKAVSYTHLTLPTILLV